MLIIHKFKLKYIESNDHINELIYIIIGFEDDKT